MIPSYISLDTRRYFTMSAQSVHEKVVAEALDRYKADLNDLSQQIWKKPEEKFEEKFAHGLLTDFLEKHSFVVTRHYKKLETAFHAEFQSSNYKAGVHPTIAVLCEVHHLVAFFSSSEIWQSLIYPDGVYVKKFNHFFVAFHSTMHSRKLDTHAAII